MLCRNECEIHLSKASNTHLSIPLKWIQSAKRGGILSKILYTISLINNAQDCGIILFVIYPWRCCWWIKWWWKHSIHTLFFFYFIVWVEALRSGGTRFTLQKKKNSHFPSSARFCQMKWFISCKWMYLTFNVKYQI